MPFTKSAPGILSMGKATFQVPQDALFGRNRQKLLNELKGSCEGVIFLRGGNNPERFDSDHEPIFRQESYFWYLTGVKEPDCAVAIDISTQQVTLFIPKLPADYATIMGRIQLPDEWKDHYQVDQVKYLDEMESTLEETLLDDKPAMNGHTTNGDTTHAGSTNNKKLYLMKGPNSDSGNMYEPPTLESKRLQDNTIIDVDTLFPILAECRVGKSETELAMLRHVTEVTSFAHAYVMRNIQPGNMEYQGESLFRHYCYYNYGCRLVGYTSICGCGPNAAVLHYGHAGEPNDRQLEHDNICLFDMGAEYFGYGSDVTCSFPASGKFNDRQRHIYRGVLQAQIDVYNMLKPGVSYLDCHKAAEAAILKNLIAMGMVTTNDKTVEELVEMRLGAVFMPHGLGHFIGIDTHDVGGYLPGHQPRIDEPGLRKLRTARDMKENMTLTVEPGCYFIDHLLDGALAEESPLKPYLNETMIQEYRGFGGVRLEDVVVITKDGCINYTLCPRTIEEVEHVMSGGKWPPTEDKAPELRRERLLDPNPLPSPPSL
ncbi:Pro aminopeptidase PEPP [Seminavis robusta]|uniref:Xaa-Pro dipeptidase n=1 Tax=Seminavis robusta TaxID=568900 RepID=A0A9N8DWK1_9STRA|nr:Pro aminopeptidase PEPP [Seminavis robusta]|eukprot:Sro349_g123410.1 Pro aminopeptidase PEPP (542) ;mRNA; f:19992-21706